MPTSDQIADVLRKASHSYYNTDKSIISDVEFDKLRNHLKKIEPNHPFFEEVGAPIPKHREEIDLIGFMGSQLKVNTEDEAKSWFNKYNQPEIIVSDKLDGSSVEIVYQNGKLHRVVTRGNGKRGMVITKNAMLWSGLPNTVNIDGQLIVRGEAQLSIENYNVHFSDTANPRNTGNGIIVCDSENERNNYINFHAFDIVHPTIEFKTQDQKFKKLKDLGFNVVRWFLCKNWDDLIKCRKLYVNSRASLLFEIDGMILDINNLEIKEAAGYADGGTRPKGSRAWKFETDRGITEVIDIEITVGTTGRLVPTAVLKPIKLAGTTVSHCLLNNFDYIEQLGLNIGSEVLIEKAGDIIPHILAVVGVEYKCPKCGFIGNYAAQERHHLIEVTERK